MIMFKRYKKLKEEVNRLKKELVEEKRNNERLKYLYETIKTESLTKRLKDYKYAILIEDSYKTYLYNEGRFENFTSLSFEVEPGYLPRVTIRK